MADILRLKENNILKVEIQDSEGTPTGEYLTFDMEDIELPLKYQELIEKHKKNLNYIKIQYQLIDKKQDIKGKKLLSKNEEDKINVLRDFYEKEMEAMDLFLGENGCKKLLNGRKPYFSMFDDIAEMIEPILPHLQKSVTNIEDKIRNKYSMKEENVLE